MNEKAKRLMLDVHFYLVYITVFYSDLSINLCMRYIKHYKGTKKCAE